MKKVCVFVDGFNLYHALDRNDTYRKYKWLNLRALATRFTTANETVTQVIYFTALATWDPTKVSKHQAYIKALATQNVTTVLGKFKVVSRKCRADCGLTGRDKIYQTHEEKETDVNIAINLVEKAFRSEFDKAIIISGDSDLIPAIKAVKRFDTKKEIVVVIPIGLNSLAIKAAADVGMKMKEEHLASSLLPRTINLASGNIVTCPAGWLPG